MARTASILILTAIFLSGCSVSRDSDKQRPLVVTPELRAALKVGYGGELPDDRIAVEFGPAARALDATLREVGAKFAPDGKMYDRNGKEIYLWSHGPAGGMVRSADDIAKSHEESQRALAEARRRYTVIEVGYWGPQPP
jgi:hypothetical protein